MPGKVTSDSTIMLPCLKPVTRACAPGRRAPRALLIIFCIFSFSDLNAGLDGFAKAGLNFKPLIFTLADIFTPFAVVVVDTGAALVLAANALVLTGDAVVEATIVLEETTELLVDTGAADAVALVLTGAAVVEVSMVDTGPALVLADTLVLTGATVVEAAMVLLVLVAVVALVGDEARNLDSLGVGIAEVVLP
jgi:hypothetical protein